MHGEADARESGRLEWTLNDDDDDDDDAAECKHPAFEKLINFIFVFTIWG